MSHFNSPFDKQLLELVAVTAAPGKHCAANAVGHLRKAAAIASPDPAMAVFRGITAEEEAASAVFHSIQRRRYVGANHLKPKDHVQKNALVPFCKAIERLLAEPIEKFAFNPRLAIVGERDSRSLEVRLSGERMGLGGRNFIPIPPLNFSVSGRDALVDFSDEMAAVASEAGAKDILSHVRRRANERNRLLYASSAGIPKVTLGNFLEVQYRRVRMLLVIYLLIDPHKEHQLFVSQSLAAFLRMLRQFPNETDASA